MQKQTCHLGGAKNFFHSRRSVIAPSCVVGTGEEVTCEVGTGEEGRCWVNGASSASFLGIVIGEEERGSGNGGEEGRVGNLVLGIYLVEGDCKVETHIGAWACPCHVVAELEFAV